MSDWLYPDAVVETEWLEARFEDESVRVFECTTCCDMGMTIQTSRILLKVAVPTKAAISKAAFLDLRGAVERRQSYRFTMPAYDDLATICGKRYRGRLSGRPLQPGRNAGRTHLVDAAVCRLRSTNFEWLGEVGAEGHAIETGSGDCGAALCFQSAANSSSG